MTPTASEHPRRIPALVSYLHPFRIVADDGQEWKITIEEVNSKGWDYIKLHEIVGGLDVGMTAPYHMIVCFDGALGLPPIPALRSVPKAVEFFNRCLGAILLGGIYCEAVTLDNVETGAILDWKYLRASGTGSSFVNQFHTTIRLRMAPPLHAINLLEPSRLSFSRLQLAAKDGFRVLSAVPSLTPEFLLKGVTAMARQDWTSAVSNLWVIVEQLTAHLWSREILLAPGNAEASIPGRQGQLKDTRTWTAANRQEMLYQKGMLTVGTLQALYVARKSRNELVHQGKHADLNAAECAYSSVKGLLAAATSQMSIPLFSLNLADHALSDPFRPHPAEKVDVRYWMEFPKLPNEAEIDREELSKKRDAR
jgi:hypothetical protein